MIFQFDSCRKGKIRVICISGMFCYVGECNYADYLVSRGIPIPAGWGVGQVTEGMEEEEDVEQKVKDVVPLIMAK